MDFRKEQKEETAQELAQRADKDKIEVTSQPSLPKTGQATSSLDSLWLPRTHAHQPFVTWQSSQRWIIEKKDREKVKTTNRESIETIFTEALAIPSFTNTETEQGSKPTWINGLARSLFQEKSGPLWALSGYTGSPHRSVNWALVDKGKKNSYPFHHHDTVDLEDYGACRRSPRFW